MDRTESHPTRGAWIEIRSMSIECSASNWSHPTQGAWIEIPILFCPCLVILVAPHTGCVD